MASKLKLEVLTPAGSIFSDEVREVVVPTTAGDLGIFPQHTPLSTVAKPGIVSIRRNDGDKFEYVVIDVGLVEVTPESVRILVDLAAKGDSMEVLHKLQEETKASTQAAESQTEVEIASTQADALKASK